MRIRTKLLHALAALAVAVPLAVVGCAAPAQAIGPALLPVTVTNNTGRGDAVYLYVHRRQPDHRPPRLRQRGRHLHRRGPAAQLRPSPAPDVVDRRPRQRRQHHHPVPARLLRPASTSRFGEKLKFFLTPDGLVQPAPWAGGDPNHNILFDWSEFTYNDAGPVAQQLAGRHVRRAARGHRHRRAPASTKQHRRRWSPTAGNNVINEIKAQPGWANTVYTRSDGTVLRVLAPGKAADAGLFSATYLDAYITSAWNAYADQDADRGAVRATSRTPSTSAAPSGNVMNFTNSAGPAGRLVQQADHAPTSGAATATSAPRTTWSSGRSRARCAPRCNRGTLGTIDTQPSTQRGAVLPEQPDQPVRADHPREHGRR